MIEMLVPTTEDIVFTDTGFWYLEVRVRTTRERAQAFGRLVADAHEHTMVSVVPTDVTTHFTLRFAAPDHVLPQLVEKLRNAVDDAGIVSRDAAMKTFR